jgi:hypothetical protein
VANVAVIVIVKGIVIVMVKVKGTGMETGNKTENSIVIPNRKGQRTGQRGGNRVGHRNSTPLPRRSFGTTCGKACGKCPVLWKSLWVAVCMWKSVWKIWRLAGRRAVGKGQPLFSAT